MFSEKLLTLLQTFSKYDLNGFRKFLRSPYFNEQEDLVRLFEVCNTALRKGQEKALDKLAVWQQLYANKPFDDAQLRRLASELNLLALRFLALETRARDPFSEALDLQKALERPELQKHLLGVQRQVERQWEEPTTQSLDQYLAGFQWHWQTFNRVYKSVANTDFMQKLLPADQSLEIFYVIAKLKLYISWLIFRGFRSTEASLPLSPGFWEYLKEPRFAEVPLVRIYQDVVLCLTKPDEEEHFKILLKHLDQYESKMSKEDLRDCYHYAQNYCAFKVNQGKTEYFQVFFGLFKSVVRLGILLENGQVSEGVFKNMVTVSLGVKEYEWAENFIREYAAYLPAGIRENAKNFNLASLYLQQQQYGKVIELLRGVEYNDVVYSLNAKLILLRTYYELKEYLALDSLIDSFRIFLRRNKVISKTLKREYNNFLNFVRKLSTLSGADAATIARFRERVMATSSATPKKWLLEKIDELQKH